MLGRLPHAFQFAQDEREHHGKADHVDDAVIMRTSSLPIDVTPARLRGGSSGDRTYSSGSSGASNETPNDGEMR